MNRPIRDMCATEKAAFALDVDGRIFSWGYGAVRLKSRLPHPETHKRSVGRSLAWELLPTKVWFPN
jgi:hypothetical protein